MQIDEIIQKIKYQTKAEACKLPKFFTNENCLSKLKQVIGFTQLVEQQISEFSGIPSRTSILVSSTSSNSLPDQPEYFDGKIKKEANNSTKTIFARYQYYLSSVWCNAVHVANLQKCQLLAWHIQCKSLMLNFKKVSKRT